MTHEELIEALDDLTAILSELIARLQALPLARTSTATSAADRTMAALPRRLRQVLDHLLTGESEKQIARELHLSVHTVHSHVKALHRAFGVATRAELMSLWIRVEPDGRAAMATAPINDEDALMLPPAIPVLNARRLRRRAACRR